MPELRSCYFCGTPDDVKQYAVVPPRFADSEDDERRAVLCGLCKDKLMRIVEPLAEKLDAEGAQRTQASTSDSQTTSSKPTADGITMNPGSTATADTTSADETTGEETDAGADSAAVAASSKTEAATTATDDDSPPQNYRKAMRLLANREFPIDRYDVEELLGGAYDMEDAEIDAVLTYAIESGRFEDEDGTLRRG